MQTTPSSSTQADDLDIERETASFTFWCQATPGTSYVRGHLPARHLNGQCLGLQSLDLDWDQEKDVMVMPRQKGASVWQFLGDDMRSRIALELSRQGIRTLMEVDDNYLVPHPRLGADEGSWRPTIAQANARGGSGYSNEMHRMLVPLLDGVIVSTPYLRKQYLEHTDEVFLCPNTVDPADWQDLDEKPDGVLRIVYSGSKSHLRDAPQVNKALKWAARQEGVEVWLQGVNPPWTFATNVPWTESLSEYRRVLGGFHVGIAPLIGSQWANGKSDLKALEYTMAGVVPFVAHEEPYRDWWGTPFDAESSEAGWVSKLKWIVRNKDALPELLEQARTYVLNERTTTANAWKWKKAINGA